ncbi:MAG: stage III sporulation protein AC [Clostridia bacterium]|nr:stage III sporulation protein AC [Clostridia bacterium]MBQ6676990.1 stage III sporulation protein AC [Clostridia bacterium]MBR3416513.1 stage III sporulation protein AC [Clostridia bacterium]MBR6915282.1 stage III sporulation protein AC [Clostridia bacterium]
MDISVVLKVAGVGLLVAVIHQILTRSGREEMATLVSVAGIIIVLFLVVDRVSDLFGTIKKIFEL